MVFRVEHDVTGWRVVDDCLNFGPYESRGEAAEIARSLNAYDWTQGGDIAQDSIDAALLEELTTPKSIN